MLGRIHFIEKDIMNGVNNFYSGSEDDMTKKQKIVIHDATKYIKGISKESL